jgi:hypothetical protein
MKIIFPFWIVDVNHPFSKRQIYSSNRIAPNAVAEICDAMCTLGQLLVGRGETGSDVSSSTVVYDASHAEDTHAREIRVYRLWYRCHLLENYARSTFLTLPISCRVNRNSRCRVPSLTLMLPGAQYILGSWAVQHNIWVSLCFATPPFISRSVNEYPTRNELLPCRT